MRGHRVVLVAALAGLPGTLPHSPVGGLVVLRPDPGTTVEAPVEIVLRAGDRAPVGMVVWLYLDGEPLDPDTGSLSDATIPPFTLGPGERRTVEVAAVVAGGHTLTVEVSDGGTEQPESIDVPFSVSGAGSSTSLLYVGILVGVMAVAFVATRRRMRPVRADPVAQADPGTSRSV